MRYLAINVTVGELHSVACIVTHGPRLGHPNVRGQTLLGFNNGAHSGSTDACLVDRL